MDIKDLNSDHRKKKGTRLNNLLINRKSGEKAKIMHTFDAVQAS